MPQGDTNISESVYGGHSCKEKPAHKRNIEAHEPILGTDQVNKKGMLALTETEVVESNDGDGEDEHRVM